MYKYFIQFVNFQVQKPDTLKNRWCQASKKYGEPPEIYRAQGISGFWTSKLTKYIKSYLREQEANIGGTYSSQENSGLLDYDELSLAP